MTRARMMDLDASRYADVSFDTCANSSDSLSGMAAMAGRVQGTVGGTGSRRAADWDWDRMQYQITVGKGVMDSDKTPVLCVAVGA